MGLDSDAPQQHVMSMLEKNTTFLHSPEPRVPADTTTTTTTMAREERGGYIEAQEPSEAFDDDRFRRYMCTPHRTRMRQGYPDDARHNDTPGPRLTTVPLIPFMLGCIQFECKSCFDKTLTASPDWHTLVVRHTIGTESTCDNPAEYVMHDTLLCYAVRGRHVRAATWLLEGGSDPNVLMGDERQDEGMWFLRDGPETALMYASRGGQAVRPLTVLLLKHGATVLDPRVKDSPFAFVPYPEVAQKLWDAISTQRDRGEAVNRATAKYATALEIAAMLYPEMVPWLLAHGANANGHPDRSNTPLFSCFGLIRCIENIEPLVQAGADVRRVDVHGYTALHRVTEELRDHPVDEHVRILVDAGCPATARTHDGETVVHTMDPACASMSVLRILMRHGVDVYEPSPTTKRTLRDRWMYDRSESRNTDVYRFLWVQDVLRASSLSEDMAKEVVSFLC